MSEFENIKVDFVVGLLNEDCKTVKRKLRDFLIENDWCPECGSAIGDDDFEGTYESRGEFHGAPCSEWIPKRFICPECGNEEEL